MRWTQSGNELDKIARRIDNVFSTNITFYIYGAGILGELCSKIVRLVKGNVIFVDRDYHKQISGYCGCQVISPQELSHVKEEHIVVVAASQYNTNSIVNKLILSGYEEGISLFTYENFRDIYLPIYTLYAHGKLFLMDLTIVVTEKCTLRCENCAPMYPYMKSPMHYSIERLKEDVDRLWTKVDYIYDFIVTGGEPFLNPDLYGFLTYLGEKYSNNYDHIQIITNATIVPTDEMLDLLKRLEVVISVSDYTKSNPHLLNKFKEFISVLEENQIKYEVQTAENWVDFGFHKKQDKERTAEELQTFFNACNSTCRGFLNGKLIYCMPAIYAEYVINNKVEDIDNSFWSDSKKEILEYSKGFNYKGYLEMCKFCNGYLSINKNYVKAAKQLSLSRQQDIEESFKKKRKRSLDGDNKN